MHVYFSGIGGVGIGPLAMLALDCGYSVSGSDLKESEMTTLLKDRGAHIHIGQEEAKISAVHSRQSIDWFVHSSALPSDHPELAFTKQHAIKISKRDAFLNFIIDQHNLKLIAVSGTHGKTTTTGMIVWLFKQLEIPISYSIGTSISYGPPAQYRPGSEYFIYECDEFDRNFLNFKPYLSVLPSVDYDHTDTYPTQTDYIGAFTDFIAQSKHTLLWKQASEYLKISKNHSVTILDEQNGAQSSIKLAGEHMRKNAWLALQAVQTIHPESSVETVTTELSKFPGTNRRFEKLSENIYTDYAHHPIEIAATLEMANELSPNVVVVYQPHQNIRQHEIVQEGGYGNCFEGAKKVYWLPTYLSREYKDLTIIPQTTLVNTMTTKTVVEAAQMDNNLLENLKKHQSAGETIIAMSAGDLDLWLREQFPN